MSLVLFTGMRRLSAVSCLASAARLRLSRTLSVYPPLCRQPAQPFGRATDAARISCEHTLLDQNPHLKHAASSQGAGVGRDTGAGNAAPDPELPSKSLEQDAMQQQQKGKCNEGNTAHAGTGAIATAEDYFKDFDMSPPYSSKTHHVDGGIDSTHRPNEQYADPSAQYATVSKDEPYEPPIESSNHERSDQQSQKLRYGNIPRDWKQENATRPQGGPDKEDAGGLKP